MEDVPVDDWNPDQASSSACLYGRLLHMDSAERAQAEDQLRLIDGILVGMGRREEVFAVVDEANDKDEAIGRLRALLALDESCCRALLDMQVSRWTRDDRRSIEQRAADLRASLQTGVE